MPIYSFKCGTCGKIADEYRQSTDRNRRTPCACGKGTMERHVAAEHDRRGTGEFHTPIQMFSVACSTLEEVADLRSKVPDVRFSDWGVPVARTRQEKLAILKACGCSER